MAETRNDAQEKDERGPGERKAFLLRLPEPLFLELRAWAAQELRSLNGHIEYLLREAAKRRGSG